MIYMDANFFVLYNFDQTAKGENARKIQQQIIDGMKSATSSLALDEVMWVIMKTKRTEALRNTIQDIYAMPNLIITEVPGHVPLLALDLIENHNLKPRDAFHAAIMHNLGINEIVSDDPDFDRVDWIKRTKI